MDVDHYTGIGKYTLTLEVSGISILLPTESLTVLLLDHCQPAVSKIDIYVTVVLNVLTDIYLISIPAPVRNALERISRHVLVD